MIVICDPDLPQQRFLIGKKSSSEWFAVPSFLTAIFAIHSSEDFFFTRYLDCGCRNICFISSESDPIDSQIYLHFISSAIVAIKDGVSVSLTGGSGRTPRHPHPSPPSFTAAGSSVGRCKGRGRAVRSDMVNNLSNFRSICCSLVSLPKSFVNRELIGSWSRAGAVERSDCFL